MKLRNLLIAGALLAGVLSYSGCASNTKPADGAVRRLEFNGVKSEKRFSLKELNPEMPSDWSPYHYLVIEMRTSTPQRFSIWGEHGQRQAAHHVPAFRAGRLAARLRAAALLRKAATSPASTWLPHQPPHRFLLDVRLGSVRRSDLGEVAVIHHGLSD